MLKILIYLLIFFTLTLVTQVGGMVYLIILIISKKLRLNRAKTFASFAGAYLITSLVIVPLIAPAFGRTALPVSGTLKPLNFLTCLLNRHYVNEELKDQLMSVSKEIDSKFKDTKTNYLDANFPFFDGFPLFPHLSHDDGRKVDLAFYYMDSESLEYSDTASSFIGYGIYEGPINAEVNYPQQCANKGYWQYGLLGHLIPKWNVYNFKVDTRRTKELLRILATDTRTSKIFLEPHLKQRWNLNQYKNIRFHGCQAVRHDDHIHLQL